MWMTFLSMFLSLLSPLDPPTGFKNSTLFTSASLLFFSYPFIPSFFDLFLLIFFCSFHIYIDAFIYKPVEDIRDADHTTIVRHKHDIISKEKQTWQKLQNAVKKANESRTGRRDEKKKGREGKRRGRRAENQREKRQKQKIGIQLKDKEKGKSKHFHIFFLS